MAAVCTASHRWQRRSEQQRVKVTVLLLGRTHLSVTTDTTFSPGSSGSPQVRSTSEQSSSALQTLTSAPPVSTTRWPRTIPRSWAVTQLGAADPHNHQQPSQHRTRSSLCSRRALHPTPALALGPDRLRHPPAPPCQSASPHSGVVVCVHLSTLRVALSPAPVAF